MTTGKQPYQNHLALIKLVKNGTLTAAQANELLNLFEMHTAVGVRGLNYFLANTPLEELPADIRMVKTAIAQRTRRKTAEQRRRLESPDPRKLRELAEAKEINPDQLARLIKFFERRRKALAYLLSTRTKDQILTLLSELTSKRRNPKTIARNLQKRMYRGRRR